ncbi:disease resistance protein RPS4B-like [Corylus avellana]|nr:disease resistance protein RPS4B-like [Corylus avellana]
MGRCNNLAYDFKKSVLQMMCKAKAQYYGTSVCLPDIEIPNWFSHQTTGSLISFRVPSFFTGQISNLLLCVVYAANTEGPTDFDFMCTCRNKTRNPQDPLSLRSSSAYFDISEDHIFVDVMPFNRIRFEMKSGDEIEVSVEVMVFPGQQSEVKKREIQVKKCGIHLLFDDPNVGDGDISESEDRRLYNWYPCLTKSRPQSPLPTICFERPLRIKKRIGKMHA